MGMVWDYAMLCYKAIYAFNQYAINRFRQYFQDFAIANLFMILVVSIAHRSSCFIHFKIRPFSLFCL